MYNCKGYILISIISSNRNALAFDFSHQMAPASCTDGIITHKHE